MAQMQSAASHAEATKGGLEIDSKGSAKREPVYLFDDAEWVVRACWGSRYMVDCTVTVVCDGEQGCRTDGVEGFRIRLDLDDGDSVEQIWLAELVTEGGVLYAVNDGFHATYHKNFANLHFGFTVRQSSPREPSLPASLQVNGQTCRVRACCASELAACALDPPAESRGPSACASPAASPRPSPCLRPMTSGEKGPKEDEDCEGGDCSFSLAGDGQLGHDVHTPEFDKEPIHNNTPQDCRHGYYDNAPQDRAVRTPSPNDEHAGPAPAERCDARGATPFRESAEKAQADDEEERRRGEDDEWLRFRPQDDGAEAPRKRRRSEGGGSEEEAFKASIERCRKMPRCDFAKVPRTLQIEYYRRSQRMKERKWRHMDWLDATHPNRESLILQTVLAGETKTALEPNMFPYDCPQGISHWTLWSKEWLTDDDVDAFMQGWLRENMPTAVEWNVDDNMSDGLSIQLFHVHAYIRCA
mmetsp:Transcript_29351/g.72479  ORF Transcript_29351/g.72479 Transcript_29351/m.72479 type:complete len:470 (+) Transcript_29351:116-1525(+)|eukprot:CAMPEP_0206242408 /NCGR_PEP_ID=MMETSP0047_2-20121206/17043_1 /ASSEMBLY_ACC=CAM_ASM_000192 /TAXON_ID=195065 /ORGANISM="Chroomonas mesostigmatica_cf, Strain CCMP1168" /LENGTH=469 /DNA_ID=CAMNT_0053667429 /DNA_START=101 /DNA_END=1510 /DNA_ORIENTATION=+